MAIFCCQPVSVVPPSPSLELQGSPLQALQSPSTRAEKAVCHLAKDHDGDDDGDDDGNDDGDDDGDEGEEIGPHHLTKVQLVSGAQYRARSPAEPDVENG